MEFTLKQAKGKILVVNDDAAIRWSLAEALRSWGYTPTEAGTVAAGIAANREVCFQVEEVAGPADWRSVMLTGRAERLAAAADTERAVQALTRRYPQLAPALSQTRIGPWTRRGQIALYRVRPAAVYGRQTKAVDSSQE